jgi:uncharacterized protein (TIGR02266 family)
MSDSTGPHDSSHNRRHDRVRLELEIAFETETNFYWSRTENVSETGLFVATHQIMPIGTGMDLLMLVPDGAEPILASGVVRWLRFHKDGSTLAPGMGIQFGQLSERDSERIRKFMTRRPPLIVDPSK